MKKSQIIIDIFVTIVDNYGDMGFVCEFISALRSEYGEQYECMIWVDDVEAMAGFLSKSGIGEVIVGDIYDFGKSRKSAIGISMLHAYIPDLDQFTPGALILRVDYLSLDPSWVSQNGSEHILSTRDRHIIELIPSPLEGGAGLIVPVSLSSGLKQSEASGSVAIQVSEHGLLHPSQGQKQPKPPIQNKHITIFAYPDTLDRIDWDSFPNDLIVYVFAKVASKNKNIICLDFLPTHEFYTLLDTSEFVIIRGEVSWAHMIQGSVPFLWDMYRDMGGFPSEQSEQFLGFISASPEYRLVHQILNGQKEGNITYRDILGALSHSGFKGVRTHNLIHTVQKHIDRSHNSI